MVANIDGTQLSESEREILVEREFDAPRALIWRAFTAADELALWWGPKSCGRFCSNWVSKMMSRSKIWATTPGRKKTRLQRRITRIFTKRSWTCCGVMSHPLAPMLYRIPHIEQRKPLCGNHLRRNCWQMVLLTDSA